MFLRTKAAGRYGDRRQIQPWIRIAARMWRLCSPAWVLVPLLTAGGVVLGQQPATPAGRRSVVEPLAGTVRAAVNPARRAASQPQPQNAISLADWIGKPIRSVLFEGIPASRLEPLAGRLSQAVGTPLTFDYIANSLRRLFATGLYNSLAVEGLRHDDGIELIFRGSPRPFIGTVSVYGAKGATVNTQLQSVSQLAPGTRFTQQKLNRAITQMRDALAEDGFPSPTIDPILTPHPEEQLIDLVFHVDSGRQARVGSVQVTGDSGMSVGQFRRFAHLRAGSRVTHDRALSGVLKHYQQQKRYEAEVRLGSLQFDRAAHTANFHFFANRGPVVNVLVEGANISQDRITQLIPIFEEGSVDEDLLNQGNRRLRDYYQRMGYFDVKVSHREKSIDGRQVTILFTVDLGPRGRVERVSVTGSRYFPTKTLEGLLSVRAADKLDRHGSYSQALVAADEAALQNAYQNNGFPNVKVTAERSAPQQGLRTGRRARAKTAPLIVTYHIDEGKQLHVGTVRIEGNHHMNAGLLTPLLNTIPGQLFSPRNLAGDRNALLTAYLSRGFQHARVDVSEHRDAANPAIVDVVFEIHEGTQIFVRKVLLTGLHFTRPETVKRVITLHAGEPLDQSALLDTQSNLYNLALFNQVNTAVENPTGDEAYKTVLVQMLEARRWTLTYGFGFEVQTGQAQNNCAGAFAGGVACSPNGKTGVSPRVLTDITRSDIRGRNQSASLQATYGLLEQSVNLLYQFPQFAGNQDLGLALSGGYANSQAVTTYVASRLEADMRWNESFLNPGSLFSKANTIVYELNFRRVKVAASSLQVYPAAIPVLSAATRVAGPSLTWIRDTRDNAMDAHRGTYTSFQEFLSDSIFGAQADFNRVDVTNSSYYAFHHDRIVLARNTRYGQVRAFGSGASELIPLPERLYAGGPTSLRAFSENAAGPRDPETGYPIGGAGALINSTELRLPPPTLPWLGDSLSFVLFHDMGNVFDNSGEAWRSALRIHQPDQAACRAAVVTNTSQYPVGYDPKNTGPVTSTGQQGPCNFNYFSHALGMGVLYHTPVGPIRLDFAYNLNPPIYPVNINYSIPTVQGSPIPGFASGPYLGEAPHFNFFFSLGQAF